MLIEFPQENLRLKSPVLPIDFNEDGIIDFIRNSSGLLLHEGQGSNIFVEMDSDLNLGNLLKTIDFDQDGEF